MPETLEEHAKEGSTYIVNAAFTDEEGDDAVPDSVVWTLRDAITEDIINSREDVSETPAASVDILLYGADLTLFTGETNQVLRELIVEAIYDSVLADDLPLRNSVRLIIDEV